jgi:hypothetical protein
MGAVAKQMTGFGTGIPPGIGALRQREWGWIAASLQLSPQQLSIVEQILKGKGDKQIAVEGAVNLADFNRRSANFGQSDLGPGEGEFTEYNDQDLLAMLPVDN